MTLHFMITRNPTKFSTTSHSGYTGAYLHFGKFWDKNTFQCTDFNSAWYFCLHILLDADIVLTPV